MNDVGTAVISRPRASLRLRLRDAWTPLRRREFAVAVAEFLLTLAFLGVYFLLRGMRPPAVDEAVRRSLEIVRFEQQLGIFYEPAWQSAVLDRDELLQAANFIYAWLHFPVLGLVGVWLLMRDLRSFRFVRNVMVVSGLFGLAACWALPAATQRLLEVYGYDFGFVDTVRGAASSVHYFQPGPFVNAFAAVPSYHFGWIALASAAIWRSTRSRVIRGAAVALAAAMWWAVTVTGNHFFFDMVFGGVVVAGSWALVWWASRLPWRAWRGAARGRLAAAAAAFRFRPSNGA